MRMGIWKYYRVVPSVTGTFLESIYGWLGFRCTLGEDDIRRNDILTILQQQQEVAKKRSRRTVKSQRAIVGASLDVIKERRSMRPEARSAARQQAIKESKEKKAAAAAAKKADKAKNAGKGGARGTVISKAGAKGAAPKVKATTR